MILLKTISLIKTKHSFRPFIFFYNFKLNNYYNLFTLFDFFNDFINFFFLRKQNLVDQEIHPASTRIFKKKQKK